MLQDAYSLEEKKAGNLFKLHIYNFHCSYYFVCHSVLKQTAWLCLCNFRIVRHFLRNNKNAACEMASDMGSHKDLYGFLKFLKSCLKFYRRKKNPFFPIILEGLEKQMDQFLFLQNVKNTKQIFTVCLPYSFFGRFS